MEDGGRPMWAAGALGRPGGHGIRQGTGQDVGVELGQELRPMSCTILGLAEGMMGAATQPVPTCRPSSRPGLKVWLGKKPRRVTGGWPPGLRGRPTPALSNVWWGGRLPAVISAGFRDGNQWAWLRETGTTEAAETQPGSTDVFLYCVQ